MLHRIALVGRGRIDYDFGLAAADVADGLMRVESLAPRIVAEFANLPQLFAPCVFRLH